MEAARSHNRERAFSLALAPQERGRAGHVAWFNAGDNRSPGPSKSLCAEGSDRESLMRNMQHKVGGAPTLGVEGRCGEFAIPILKQDLFSTRMWLTGAEVSFLNSRLLLFKTVSAFTYFF